MIALALLFTAGFELSEHRIEILTPTQVVVGTNCNPEYLIAQGGGTVLGSCAVVEIRARPAPGSVEPGGFIVQVEQGLTLFDCSLTAARRALLPEPETLLQFECGE